MMKSNLECAAQIPDRRHLESWTRLVLIYLIEEGKVL